MKKTIGLLFAIITLIGCFTFASCGSKRQGNVKLCFIDLKNNDTGFTTSPEDTAVAIGIKKGSSLKASMDEYLSTLDSTYHTQLMAKMSELVHDDKATYTPAYDLSDRSNGVLRVGMECGYEPFNWTQKTSANGGVAIKNISGKYANGYDVQIAAQVADHLNMSLEIYMYEWDSLVPAVKSGAIDAIVAGMSPTAERKEEIDFSVPYYQSNLVIVTRENSEIATCLTLADIDKAGVKIAAQPGTFHLDVLKEQTSALTVIETLEDFVAMKVALEAGTIDGYVAEEPTAMAFCQ